MRRMIAAVVMLLVSVCSAAQEYQRAKQIAAQAQQSIEQGNFDAARETLLAGALGCGRGDEADRCRLYLYYSLGYLEQRQSQETTSLVDMHLERSAGYYEQVLQSQPHHGPTLNNLALVYASAGDDDRAAELLARAVEHDPARAGQYALQLGDLQIDVGNEDAALTAYRVAARQSPKSKVPLRRMIDVYRSLRADRLSELHELCKGWEAWVPDVARDGYAAGMQTAARADDTSAEQFLMDWLRLMAFREWLSPDAFRALPGDWSSPAVVDLRAFVDGQGRPDDWKGWWLEDVERRQVLGLAAVALARERLGRGDTAGTDAFIEGGLSIAPPIGSYLNDGPLTGRRVVRLDLLADLASLSYRFPDLDISLEFGEIEDRLFSGKFEAYRELDLETIQRFHTVLGLIYAERGTWQSGRNFHNGIFQLSRAIDTAKRRETASGFYQPQPSLMEKLADGYRIIRDEWEATISFVDAAQAYLDTDQLDQARKMLEAVGSSGSRSAHARAAQLAEIVDLRIAVEENGSVVRIIHPESTPFLYPESDRTLDEKFLARQRFKIFADGSTELAPMDAVMALNTALDTEFTLVGTPDILRLEKVQELTLLTLGPETIIPMLTAQPSGDSGLQLEIVLPGESRPKFVRIGHDGVVAARIGRIVQPRTIWKEGAPQYRVDDGAVIYIDTDLRQTPDLLDQIRNIPGVTAVRPLE